MKVTKECNGKIYTYYHNGKKYRKSENDYKFACVVTFTQEGHCMYGQSMVVCLGNNESSVRSKGRFFRHYCDVKVVVIENN